MIYYLEIAARFLSAAIVGLLVPSLILVIVRSRRQGRSQQGTEPGLGGHLITLGALALVGAAAGISGGMSRAPAVGDIIPAFLALLGGVAIYLFTIHDRKGTIASLCSAVLAISLVAGFSLASEYRNANSDDRRELRAICSKAYTNADLLGDDRAFMRFEGKMKNLCTRSMKWSL